MQRRRGRVELDVDPGDGGPRRDADRAPADERPGRSRPVEERLEPLERQRRARGQRPLGLELDERREPLRLARSNGLRREVGQPLAGIRVTAPHGQLGEHGLRHELRDADALLELGPRRPAPPRPTRPARSRSQASVVAMYEARL